MIVTIDPTTGVVADSDRELVLTLAEIAAATAPCPVCREPVSFRAVDIGNVNTQSEPRRFMLGRWSCQRNCDPTANR